MHLKDIEKIYEKPHPKEIVKSENSNLIMHQIM
jgi:hypothetical protein